MSQNAARWYVVHTQAHSEGKALFNLLRQGFTVYLPRYMKRRRHARRVDYIPRPLFPRYIFVLLDTAVQRWRVVQSTAGVLHLICHGDHPVPLPSGVIDEIRSREGVDGLVEISEIDTLRNGQSVRIIEGPLSDCCAILERIGDDGRVALLLDLLGRQVRVLLPKGVVAAA